MVCPKCKSHNVSVQAVSVTKNKKHGFAYWVLFGWLIDMFLWLFLFVPRLLVSLFGAKKIKTKVHSYAVCQQCGKHRRI